MTNDTQSYQENFNSLKGIAEELRAQTEPDIDALVPKVERAMAAYKGCKERLGAVRKALGEVMPKELAE